MKKIVGIIAILAMVASLFAVDFSAKVYMNADIAKSNGDNVDIFVLNAADQKDADALQMSVNGDNAGASFKLWYNYASGDNDPKIRGANLWFKPSDMFKVTVGEVSVGTYTEMLHWWKAPIGTSLSASQSWNGKYSSYATVEGSGLSVDITPVDGLLITGGIAAGTGTAFIATGDTTAVKAYGIGAKYSNIAGLPLSAAITWRDAGTDANKVLAIGADYGNAWADGFYGFINARMNFDVVDEASELNGIAFDNYFKFTAGALVAQLRAPVIVRLSGEETDPSYMEFSGKVSYNVGAATPYLLFGSDLDNGGEISFADFGGTFLIQIKPGVTFNVGSCSFDTGFKLNIPAGDADATWSVPCEMTVAF